MVSSVNNRPSEQPGRPSDGGAYTVKAGDNLSAIAARHGTTLGQILELNPQFRSNPDLIHPGQLVRLPQGAADADEGRTQETPLPRSREGGRPIDRIIDKTARVEGGGRYDAFNPNDNGHGISFGLIQFNQKVGSLPTLMREMHTKDPQRFNQIFGADAQSMLSEDFVRQANLSTPEWRARFRQAGAHEPFQQVQRDLARREYLEPAQRAAARLGVTSERGVAMAFDAAVQLGVGGMERRMREAAAGGGSEHDILTRFAASADNVTGGRRRRRNLLNDPTLRVTSTSRAPSCCSSYRRLDQTEAVEPSGAAR